MTSGRFELKNRIHSDIVVREGATPDQIQEAFMTAADKAVATNRPVFVEY